MAHLALDPDELKHRLAFTHDHDDFDDLPFTIVNVAGTRFLLIRYLNNPEPGTTVESSDAGDPVGQATPLARTIDVGSDVTTFRDDRQRQHGPLQPTTAR